MRVLAVVCVACVSTLCTASISRSSAPTNSTWDNVTFYGDYSSSGLAFHFQAVKADHDATDVTLYFSYRMSGVIEDAQCVLPPDALTIHGSGATLNTEAYLGLECEGWDGSSVGLPQISLVTSPSGDAWSSRGHSNGIEQWIEGGVLVQQTLSSKFEAWTVRASGTFLSQQLDPLVKKQSYRIEHVYEISRVRVQP